MKLPYAAVEFTKDGHVADPSQVTAALAMLDRVQATDVLVLAHGWNNDIGAAERLYTHLTDNLADLIPAGSPARPAVIGILWPSVRWADEDQLAGGGVSVGDDLTALTSAIAASVDDPELAARLSELAGRLDTTEGRAAFLAATRDLLPEPAPADAPDEDPAPAALRTGRADEVFDSVRVAVSDVGDDLPGPGAPGVGAPGVGARVAPDLLSSGTSGAGLFGRARY